MKLFVSIKIIIFVSLFASLQGMDSSIAQHVNIVDLNVCDDIHQIAPDGPVVVMGYTPNFSKFREFCAGVIKAYGDVLNPSAPTRTFSGELVSHVQTKKQLDAKFGVEVSKMLRSAGKLEMDISDDGLNFEACVDLFLAHSFDREAIVKKARMLFAQAKKVAGAQHVIHTFVPYPYFQEAKIPADLARRYLNRCAKYYKKLYEEAGGFEGLHISIVIPLIEQKETDPFVTCFNGFKQASDTVYGPGLTCNTHVIHTALKALVAQAQEKAYVFLNTAGVGVDFDRSNNFMCQTMLSMYNFRTSPVSVELQDGTFSCYRSSDECRKDPVLCSVILEKISGKDTLMYLSALCDFYYFNMLRVK